MSYYFHNYIVGQSNKLASEAAWMVSNDNTSPNPLYIYGNGGVGKTHLIHAIKNHVTQRCSPLYITGEEFTNEWIRAICEGHGSQVRSKYCDTTDYLLVDNVHVLTRMERVQEEFLHIFHALNETGAQIVVSANVPPKAIYGLNPQLLEFFEKGLIVEIQPPTDALMHDVFMQHMGKIHGDDIPISGDVIDLVVKNSLDFHALLKYVDMLNSYIELTGKAITMKEITPL